MRSRITTAGVLLGCLALVAWAATGVVAGEHPTSAPAGTKASTPEKPPKIGAPVLIEAPTLTAKELAGAIEAHAGAQAAKSGGWYEIEDPADKKTLELKLERVHEERLAKVGPDTYFACADFKSKDGVLYDLDFFMKGRSKDDLAFTEVSIHKKAGVERYGWVEEEGVWKKKIAGASEHPKDEGGHEHPEGAEHPH